MSKGTQTRLAQIPEQAKFLMNRFVTDLSTDVLQVDHSTMTLPASRDTKDKQSKGKKKTPKHHTHTPPKPSNNNFNRFECSLVQQIKILVWTLPGVTTAQTKKSVMASGFINQMTENNYTPAISSQLLVMNDLQNVRGKCLSRICKPCF